VTLTIARPQTVEEVYPIKPSEALRLGRLTRPRHIVRMYMSGNDGACAIGAIAQGWAMGPITAHQVLNSAYNIPINISKMYDDAEMGGQDGDAVVLRYLEERGY
jgi:hypothetical protein